MNDFSFLQTAESQGVNLAELSNIQKIELAEYMLKASFENEGDTFPLKHTIENGVYVREIFLPKGALLTGRVHNFDHMSFIPIGDVTVMTPEGTERIVGPKRWGSRSGTKRLIQVNDDTIWMTFHISDKSTVEELEAELVHHSDLTWIEELKLLPGGNNVICSDSGSSSGSGSWRSGS